MINKCDGAMKRIRTILFQRARAFGRGRTETWSREVEFDLRERPTCCVCVARIRLCKNCKTQPKHEETRTGYAQEICNEMRTCCFSEFEHVTRDLIGSEAPPTSIEGLMLRHYELKIKRSPRSPVALSLEWAFHKIHITLAAARAKTTNDGKCFASS